MELAGRRLDNGSYGGDGSDGKRLGKGGGSQERLLDGESLGEGGRGGNQERLRRKGERKRLG